MSQPAGSYPRCPPLSKERDSISMLKSDRSVRGRGGGKGREREEKRRVITVIIVRKLVLSFIPMRSDRNRGERENARLGQKGSIDRHEHDRGAAISRVCQKLKIVCTVVRRCGLACKRAPSPSPSPLSSTVSTTAIITTIIHMIQHPVPGTMCIPSRNRPSTDTEKQTNKKAWPSLGTKLSITRLIRMARARTINCVIVRYTSWPSFDKKIKLMVHIKLPNTDSTFAYTRKTFGIGGP